MWLRSYPNKKNHLNGCFFKIFPFSHKCDQLVTSLIGDLSIFSWSVIWCLFCEDYLTCISTIHNLSQNELYEHYNEIQTWHAGTEELHFCQVSITFWLHFAYGILLLYIIIYFILFYNTNLNIWFSEIHALSFYWNFYS